MVDYKFQVLLASSTCENVRDCVYWPNSYLNYSQKKDYCTAKGLDKARVVISSKVDVMLYVRPFYEGEAIFGHGGYLSAASVYDGYNIVAKQVKTAGVNYPEAVYESLRYGHYNAQTMMHEFGHVLAAGYEVSDVEPVYGDGSYGRAYTFGPVTDTATGDKDYTTKRLIIMSRVAAALTKPHHAFYSDPNIFIEGEACRSAGVADNAKYARDNLPLAAKVNELPAKVSDIFFVQSELIFNRTEGKGTVTLRRTSDLTKPAYVNVIAADGTAWEQRDFDFGLKEVVFAAGESEKTVEFTMLERAGGHVDTQFSVKMIGAMNATFTSESLNVKIVSDKSLQTGQVGFKDSQITTAEGNVVEVLLTRTDGSDGAVSVNVKTVSGTAVAGTDFTALDQTVNFAECQTTASVTVPLINRTGSQGSRSFSVEISNPAGGLAEGRSVVTVTITDASGQSGQDCSEGSSSVGSTSIWFVLPLFLNSCSK